MRVSGEIAWSARGLVSMTRGARRWLGSAVDAGRRPAGSWKVLPCYASYTRTLPALGFRLRLPFAAESSFIMPIGQLYNSYSEGEYLVNNTVIDASAIIAVIAGEPEREELIKCTQGTGLSAPPSVHWEIGNALSAMLKRRRNSLVQALKAISAYQQIPIRFVDIEPVELGVGSAEIVSLVRESRERGRGEHREVK